MAFMSILKVRIIMISNDLVMHTIFYIKFYCWRYNETMSCQKTMDCILWELASPSYKVSWHISGTMKYRSKWPTNCMRSSIVSHCRGILNKMSFYYIRSDIQGKITGLKYRSQWPTNSMRSFTVSNWTSIWSMMPSYLIRFEIQRTRPVTGTG